MVLPYVDLCSLGYRFIAVLLQKMLDCSNNISRLFGFQEVTFFKNCEPWSRIKTPEELPLPETTDETGNNLFHTVIQYVSE